MIFVLLWILFAILVGAAAAARGRDPALWTLLACLISPLLGILILIAFPVIDRRTGKIAGLVDERGPFQPEAIYAGIPYRVLPDGRIEALLHGAPVLFTNMDQMTAAAQNENWVAPPPATFRKKMTTKKAGWGQLIIGTSIAALIVWVFYLAQNNYPIDPTTVPRGTADNPGPGNTSVFYTPGQTQK
jgi:hypothetical protein